MGEINLWQEQEAMQMQMVNEMMGTKIGQGMEININMAKKASQQPLNHSNTRLMTDKDI